MANIDTIRTFIIEIHFKKFHVFSCAFWITRGQWTVFNIHNNSCKFVFSWSEIIILNILKFVERESSFTTYTELIKFRPIAVYAKWFLYTWTNNIISHLCLLQEVVMDMFPEIINMNIIHSINWLGQWTCYWYISKLLSWFKPEYVPIQNSDIPKWSWAHTGFL